MATVRVMVWHAYGAPWLTWMLASIPAMFFVSGSLLARSAARRHVGAVLLDRFRRLAVPLWSFAAVAWASMAVAAVHTGGSLPVRRVLWWLVPLLDPVGTSWEGGWLASPLWYLRVLVWVLLASPLLLVVARRLPRVGLSCGIVAVVGCEILVRRGTWTPSAAPRLWWYLADFALYATFFAAGAAFEQGRRTHRRFRARWALLPAAGVVIWVAVVGAPTGVVNDSHVLHLLVGATWLLLALSCRPLLRTVADRPAVRRAIGPFSRYSLTIYLWHSTAIVLALALRRVLPGAAAWTAVLYPVAGAGFLVVAVLIFGPTERRAARSARPGAAARLRPGLLASGTATIALLVLAHTSMVDASVPRPRVPSQAPPIPREIDLIVTNDLPVTPRELPAVLDRLFTDWLAEHEIAGGSVGMLAPDGWRWATAQGVWATDGRPVTLEDDFETMSVTKMFTGALVAQAVTAALTDFDSPIGDIGVTGISPTQVFTLRQLLEHTTGLANWRATPEAWSAAEAQEILSPIDAVRAALRLPRAPAVPSYSSTNSIVAAMTLEHLAGRSYEELASDELDRLGLNDSRIEGPNLAGANHGSAGLVTTVEDLLELTQHILVTHDGIDTGLNTIMRSPSRTTGVGLGTTGLCPCDETSSSFFGLVGHYGGYTIAAIDPATDIAIVINLTQSLWEVPGLVETTAAFLVRLLHLASDSLGP